MLRLVNLSKLRLNGQEEKRDGGGGVKVESEEGGSHEGVEIDGGGVHGRREIMEMVPKGELGTEKDWLRHKRTWFSDASFGAVGVLFLEMGVYWRYSLSEEERKRAIRSRKGGNGNRLSINVLELMRMVMTTYVRIVIRRDRSTKEGDSLLVVGGKVIGGAVGNYGGGEGGGGEVGGDDEDYGGVGDDARVDLPRRARAGHEECFGGRDNEVERN